MGVAQPKRPAPDSQEALTRHLAWLQITDCPCEFAYKNLSRLHGVDCGKGWVRMTTEPDCPHHGENRR